MRQVMEGFESEFESLMAKKKVLEANMAKELEVERKRIEKKYGNMSTAIDNMLILISFEVPEEEVVKAQVVEEAVEEKVSDPIPAQPSPQVKKGSILSRFKSRFKEFISKMKKAFLHK